ncbi:TPA: sugar phosphate isomerase/epimerase [Escherichia coli]|nr:sugar phosphate isomerase/epimerase [Escherichia coli]
MRDLLQRPDLFSINTATLGYKTPLPAIIDACAARGIGAIAPWRRELQSEDLQQIARQLAASNMNVSGLCRSTYYTAPTLAERKLAIDDNRRALDDAAVLNAACYMQVVGGLPMGTKDLYEAREQVKQGIRQLLPHSKEVGVPIALEPLHPMTAADRSCLCTLRQALDWCDELDPDGEFGLGVAVDVYHVWWDPDLASQILRAGKRILAFHVSDWLVPTTDLVNDRECREMVSSIFRQFVGWLKTPDLMALLNWKYSHRTGGRKILTARGILASIASHIIVKE